MTTLATTIITPDEAAALRVRFAQEPSFFFKHVLHWEPYNKQVEMADAVKHYTRTVVVGCNASGKDALAARLGLWWLQVWGKARVVIFGPSHRQVQDIIWAEARSAFANAALPLGGEILKTPDPGYTLDVDRQMLGFATDDPSTITGQHSPKLLVIVTEAHAVTQEAWERLKTLQPFRLLIMGNPFCDAGEFYDAFHDRDKGYHAIQISALDSPNVKTGQIIVPGLISRQQVEDAKRDWGEDSPMYRASILGQFSPGASAGFRNIEGCIDAGAPLSKPPEAGRKYLASWDHATTGDYNWLSVADVQTGRVVHLDRWTRVPIDVTRLRVVEACQRYNNAKLVMDATAESGDILVEDMVKAGLQVEPFVFTNESKRQGVGELMMALEREQIRFPNHPELIKELKVFRAEKTPGGRLTWNAPSGYNDDGVSSLIMLVHELPKNQIGKTLGRVFRLPSVV